MKNTISKLNPPAFLHGSALDVWNDLAPEVEALGAAVGIESHALACLCISIADLEAADAAIAEHGLVHKTERGITKNPAASLKNQAMQNIHKFCTSFGLTPSSRTKTLHARRLNQTHR